VSGDDDDDDDDARPSQKWTIACCNKSVGGKRMLI
jgi:hypothetical protein